MKRNQSQSAMQKAGQSASGSQQRTPETHRRKRKCSCVYFIRMIFGIAALICVIVLTGVQTSGWQAIADALFGGITLMEVIRYVVIVLLSMAVGYWMKKPYKVYVRGGNGNKSKGSEADEQKAEE